MSRVGLEAGLNERNESTEEGTAPQSLSPSACNVCQMVFLGSFGTLFGTLEWSTFIYFYLSFSTDFKDWFPEAVKERDELYGLHGNPDHVGYLTVGSDVETEDAEPKGQRTARPIAHESQPHEEDADPGSSDEERTSPPSRFSSGNELHSP